MEEDARPADNSIYVDDLANLLFVENGLEYTFACFM